MRRERDALGALAPAVDHFLKVTASYWPGLFHCYDVPDLPRTNNDLEQCFGSARYHERRATGRGGLAGGLVVRGAVRLVAAVAARSRRPGRPAPGRPRRLATLRQHLRPARRPAAPSAASATTRPPTSRRSKTRYARRLGQARPRRRRRSAGLCGRPTGRKPRLSRIGAAVSVFARVTAAVQPAARASASDAGQRDAQHRAARHLALQPCQQALDLALRQRRASQGGLHLRGVEARLGRPQAADDVVARVGGGQRLDRHVRVAGEIQLEAIERQAIPGEGRPEAARDQPVDEVGG